MTTTLEPQQLQQIEPYLYLFQGAGSFRVNSIVLEDHDCLYLIDTQLEDENNHALIAAIKTSFPTKPLRLAVISHYHLDHYAGLPLFRQAFGAFEVIGPPDARRCMDAATAVIWEAYERESPEHQLTPADLLYPDREINQPFALAFSGRSFSMTLIGPNEAWSTLIGLLPDTRTLYISDLYFGGIYIDPRIGGTVLGWQRAMEQIITIPAEQVIAGHTNRLYTHADLRQFSADLSAFVAECQQLFSAGISAVEFQNHVFQSDLTVYAPDFSLANIYQELGSVEPSERCF
ncbi:MAG: MBL fold metallo-hydrolase [Herpetosiphonaceae bacterium]|nr:MBL fold metallo-hydrolase [Herpetosiphonaceae bacterium]